MSFLDSVVFVLSASCKWGHYKTYGKTWPLFICGLQIRLACWWKFDLFIIESFLSPHIFRILPRPVDQKPSIRTSFKMCLVYPGITFSIQNQRELNHAAALMLFADVIAEVVFHMEQHMIIWVYWNEFLSHEWLLYCMCDNKQTLTSVCMNHRHADFWDVGDGFWGGFFGHET